MVPVTPAPGNGRFARRRESAVRAVKALLSVQAGPAVLMYHRVAREAFDPWGLAVTPERFGRQARWLARRRRVMPLPELVNRHREGTLQRNAVAITFDDGYACNLANAAPALERNGLPATVFLAADLIERGKEFWWDELERLVLHCEARALHVDEDRFDLGPRQSLDSEWPPGSAARTPRQRAFLAIWTRLRPKPPSELDSAMDALRNQCGGPRPARESHRPMTPQEARRLPSELVEIGSHSLTHPSLPSLGPAEKARQIGESIERCAAIAGARPRSFAYPYGDFDAQCEQLAMDAGFTCACTTEHGFVGGDSRPSAIPRIHVGDWSPAQLARVLAA